MTNQAPGAVRFFVREAVYDSATGQQVVIPQWSSGLLQVQGTQIFGDERLPVRVTALTLPDGRPLKLASAAVGDPSGMPGFRDQLKRKWGSVLASILVTGVLRGGTTIVAGYGGGPAERIAGALAQEGANEGSQKARQFINTSPVMTIRNGYLGTIMLTEPLDATPVGAR